MIRLMFLIIAIFFTTNFVLPKLYQNKDTLIKEEHENISQKLAVESQKKYYYMSGECHAIPSNYIVLADSANKEDVQHIKKITNPKCDKKYSSIMLSANFIDKNKQLIFQPRDKWGDADMLIFINDEYSIYNRDINYYKKELNKFLELEADKAAFLSPPKTTRMNNFNGHGQNYQHTYVAKTVRLAGAAFQQDIFWPNFKNMKDYYVVKCENIHRFADNPKAVPIPMGKNQLCKINFYYKNTRIEISIQSHLRGKYNIHYESIIYLVKKFLDDTKL